MNIIGGNPRSKPPSVHPMGWQHSTVRLTRSSRRPHRIRLDFLHPGRLSIGSSGNVIPSESCFTGDRLFLLPLPSLSGCWLAPAGYRRGGGTFLTSRASAALALSRQLFPAVRYPEEL
ncbi:hypothetical protein [Thermoplasma acidophilum]|uniref:Uncharacterized protein n=1 Tax=Thermoplasma acidophilum (strain ATCC 25905 / DSM 1728 / JCM 9062 / NBRC 15155 / AMRC-C165) TaxID=273075 RepID=Q9HJC1_THEAC|nr:hypothetical protein [Thermoplasma acidophilum]